jgi:hypothetical protein
VSCEHDSRRALDLDDAGGVAHHVNVNAAGEGFHVLREDALRGDFVTGWGGRFDESLEEIERFCAHDMLLLFVSAERLFQFAVYKICGA